MARYLMLAGAWACCALGAFGVLVPVLPTTPLLLLATFLFARSSERCHVWICSTRLYRTYVLPYKNGTGMTRAQKARALTVSFAVLGLSAFLCQNAIVWTVLACVAAFLLYLMLVRIPTKADADD